MTVAWVAQSRLTLETVNVSRNLGLCGCGLLGSYFGLFVNDFRSISETCGVHHRYHAVLTFAVNLSKLPVPNLLKKIMG